MWTASSVLNPKQREESLNALRTEHFDVLVLGGGVTGAGIALDAVTRGLKTALVEAQDYAAGTSSRSSKLIHGGLRYLEQYDFKLVREALHERELMVTTQAPHLVKPLSFLYPLHHKVRERTYVGAGLALYDALRGLQRALPNHKHLSHKTVQEIAPCLNPKIVIGGIEYFDAQVDDARHTMMIQRTAAMYGAHSLTRVRVEELIREGGKVVGARVTDLLTGENINVRSRVVIMAGGVWTNELHEKFGVKSNFTVRMSKGVHILVPKSAIASETGMILKTAISVLFIIPWDNKWLIGTTDTDYTGDKVNPLATKEDIDYILREANKVLVRPLTTEDILGAYAGLRPLVSQSKAALSTKTSREHMVHRAEPGFVSIAGGKYTTYRVMAEHAVEAAAPDLQSDLPESITKHIPILGAPGFQALVNSTERLAKEFTISTASVKHLLNRHGSDIFEVGALITEDPSLSAQLCESLPYLRAEIAYAVSHEGALSVLDVIARRTRISFESGDYGVSVAEDISKIIAPTLGWSEEQRAASLAEFYAFAKAESESASH